MVPPNLLSRLLPTSGASPSVYEELREHDESSDVSDIEDRAGMAIDERNLEELFEDYELDNPEILAVEESTAESTAFLTNDKGKQRMANAQTTRQSPREGRSRPSWMKGPTRIPDPDYADDDVPASLLIEDHHQLDTATDRRSPRRISNPADPPGAAPSVARAQWQAVQAQQRLHQDDAQYTAQAPRFARGRGGFAMSDPKERAMWRWVNVSNLDNFVRDVYDYFLGNGIWCILLSRIMSLL